jgi:hypothetical protein
MQVLEQRTRVDRHAQLSVYSLPQNSRTYGSRRWWLAAATIVVLSYLPLLTANFGRHNDYLLWACDTSGAIKQFPEMWHLLAIGRPLGAILLNLHFTCLHALSDFVVSRAVALGLTLIAAWLLAEHLLRRPRMPLPLAICAAACVFLLPASQLFVSWLTNFVPGTLTVLLALLAYRTLDGGREDTSARVPLVRWRRFLIAEALFIAALLIYPPSALFVLVPAFGNLVFTPLERWPETRRRLARDFAFVFVGMLTYFVGVRYVYLPVVVRYWPLVGTVMEQNRGGPYEVAVSFHFHDWLRNLRDIAVVSLSGPWHAVVSSRTAIRLAKLVACGLLAGWSWHVWRSRSSEANREPRISLSWAVQAFLAGAALFLLSEAPSILAHVDGIAGYRVVFPAEAMVALAVFALLAVLRPWPARDELTAFRPIFPVTLLLVCASLAFWNLRNVAASAVAELNCYRRELATVDPATTRELQVICPSVSGSFLDVPLKMDFWFLGSHHDLSVPGMVKIVLQERGVEIGDLKVTVAHANGPSSTATIGVTTSSVTTTAVTTAAATTIIPSAGTRTIDTSRAAYWKTD